MKLKSQKPPPGQKTAGGHVAFNKARSVLAYDEDTYTYSGSPTDELWKNIESGKS